MYHDNAAYYKNIFWKKDGIRRYIRFLCYFTGAVRFYKDGDGLSAYHRLWHPLNWLLFILFSILAGVPEAFHELFIIPDYWKNKQIVWFSIWER